MDKTLTLLLAVVVPMTAGAIGERDFSRDWNDWVAPWIAEHSTMGQLTGAGGVTLRYLAVEQARPRAALLILGGHSESFYKYAELMYDLRDLGVSIYALDPRGQGASDRLLPDHDKSHVDHWQSYVSDLAGFVDTVVRPRTRAPIIALGHSLGGAIVAAYLEQHPAALDSAILSAPLVGHKLGGAVKALFGALDTLGGTGYVPGGGPFVSVPFEANKETHSEARHARKFQDYVDHPEIRLGYPTVHWMTETSRMAESVLAGAPGISVPVMVFQATQDVYVDPRALELFISRVSGCRRVVVPGARHEMLIETDAIRDTVLGEVRAFIQDRISAAGS